MRTLLIVCAGLMLASCGTTYNYLSTNYTGQHPDATMGDFYVFANRTKPKLLVSVNGTRAAGIGLASTFANAAPSETQFDQVAQQWTTQNRPGCTAINGHSIGKMFYEYDIHCQ